MNSTHVPQTTSTNSTPSASADSMSNLLAALLSVQAAVQGYALPVVCAFGLVSNLVIVLVFGGRSAARECGATIRIYYVVIAVADEVHCSRHYFKS